MEVMFKTGSSLRYITHQIILIGIINGLKLILNPLADKR